MLSEAVEKFSADATRLALGFAGDTLETANFETDIANANTNLLFIEEKFTREILEECNQGKLRTDNLYNMEKNVLNEMNCLISETEKHFDRMFWRDGLNAGSNGFRILRDFYREWCARMEIPMHSTIIMRYIEASTIMIAPICPHFAENIWMNLLKNENSVLQVGIAENKEKYLCNLVFFTMQSEIEYAVALIYAFIGKVANGW